MESQSTDDCDEQSTNGSARDSSNDEGGFRDSSNDDGHPETSCIRDEAQNFKDKPLSNSNSSQSTSDRSTVTDEAAMMLMSEAEQQHYDQFVQAHHGQMSSLKCTTCSCQLFVAKPEELRIHPALGVLICKNCREFYSKGPFTKDSTGHDEYCRWCAEGGIVICCDTCSNVFCKACLRRCIGRAALLEISNSDSNWSCLLCENTPIWLQRAQCRLAFSLIEKESRNRRKSRSSRLSISRLSAASPTTDMNEDPAVWLPAMLNQAEKLAAHFKQRISQVVNNWSKENIGSENDGTHRSSIEEEEKRKVMNCCRKLRKAMATYRFNMKLLDKKLVTNYTRKYRSAVEIEVDTGSSDEQHNFDGNKVQQHGKGLVMKFKNFREGKNENSFYAEIDGAPLPSSDETASPKRLDSANSIATVPIYPNPSILKEGDCKQTNAEKTQSLQAQTTAVPNEDGEQIFGAASRCLEEVTTAQRIKKEPSPENTSENISCAGESFSKIDNSTHPNQTDSSTSSSKVGAQRSQNSTTSNLNFNSSPNLERVNEQLRRELLKDSSEDSDSCSGLNSSPRVKRTQKRNRTEPAELEDDPKLKAECAVVLDRIDKSDIGSLMKKSRTSLNEAAIDRKINRLLKSDSSSSSDHESDSDEARSNLAKNTKKKSRADKSKEPEKKMDFTGSDSTSEPSDSEETISKTNKQLERDVPTQTIDPNEAARLQLLESSSSDTEPYSDAEEAKQGVETLVKEEVHPESSPNMLEEVEIDSSESVKLEMKEESLEEAQAEKPKERERSLSPETAKLLRDPIEKGNKKPIDADGELPEAKKKSQDKRKRRIVDSDSDFESAGSNKEEKQKSKKRKPPSSDEDFKDEAANEAKPKRRRRIKKIESSDSEASEASDDSDIQILNESQRSDGGTGSKGRKNIKKIIKDQNLKDETKAAAKEEEERKKRIADRQKLYNTTFVGNIALENARIDKLVLDFDPKTKEELVTVDERLVTKLKPHQVKGVRFMWDACFESIERIKEHPGSGCILAHCMGLGKSLQVVTLSHTVLTHKDCKVERVLVVCPLSTVLNWLNEFTIWLPDSSVPVYELTSAKTNDLRVSTLRRWMESGGVMIIGYDMYRNLSNEQNKRMKAHARARETFQRALVDPGPELVVCDEGHLLKNEATALSKAMNRIATKRRVVLTGTPLQNSLLEYHCMIQFVKPNLLGTKKEFTNRFANPIKNGQAADSTDHDVRLMKRRAHVLHKMLEDSVQRFDYSVLTPFLPPKHEYVISVRMSELQIQMYQYYLEKHAKGVPGFVGRGKGAGLFADFQELGRVWTHPRALQLSQLRREQRAAGLSDTEGSMADFIDDRETPTTEEEAPVVCLDTDESDGGEVVSRKPRTRASRGDQPPPEDELGVTVPISAAWWSQFVSEDDMAKMEHSGKLVLLMDVLRQCELIGDKVLVFSQSLVSLDLIEEFLQIEDKRNEENRANLGCEASSEKVDNIGSWQLNADYFRLDGQTSAELRKNWCNTFNDPSNNRARLFLISTKAGGLGINLVAANRVIIFDASWNPSHDVQSIFRVYRFGQRKPCYIYRFLAQGTMEEKIYDRQVTKLSLSCRVVDEQQIERHFNSADLNELYVFEPDSHLRRPTPLLPKDRLLAELTIQRKEWIVTYHEHDSLLENKAEEELTEDERKAAWEDFENEKRGHPQIGYSVPVDPLATPYSIPGMSEIFASLAGRSVAGIPLSNIAAMIYNSNPGISQDEFVGRLRLTVDQLQNFSVQQAAAAAAPAPPPTPAAPQISGQQPGDAHRLMMQRQVAQDQLKRQFGNSVMQPAAVPGPSGLSAANPLLPARSRGRPTIGPHQRTDIYGLGPVIAASAQQAKLGVPPSGQSAPPKT